jgi:hypothetical protein
LEERNIPHPAANLGRSASPSSWEKTRSFWPRTLAVFGVTIKRDKIVEFDILGDPERLAQLDLIVLDD